jgi:hypothetical protein
MNGMEEQVFSLAFSDHQDHRYVEQMDTFLDSSGIKNCSFDSVVLSWSCYRTILIPSNVFEEGSAPHFFELCFGSQIQSEDIKFDRLQSQGIVNIYQLPTWVSSYFSSRFPKIVIRHEGSHLIQHLFSSRFSELEVIVTIHNGYFLLCIGREDKLICYSSFDYQEADDILYHVMFTLQEKDFYNLKGNIQLFGGQGISYEFVKELKESLSKIVELKSLAISTNQELIPNSLEQCV